MYQFHIHKTTISKIIPEISIAIYSFTTDLHPSSFKYRRVELPKLPIHGGIA